MDLHCAQEQEELQWRREQEAARREAERRRVDEEQHKWRRLREEEQRQRAAIEQVLRSEQQHSARRTHENDTKHLSHCSFRTPNQFRFQQKHQIFCFRVKARCKKLPRRVVTSPSVSVA